MKSVWKVRLPFFNGFAKTSGTINEDRNRLGRTVRQMIKGHKLILVIAFALGLRSPKTSPSFSVSALNSTRLNLDRVPRGSYETVHMCRVFRWNQFPQMFEAVFEFAIF